MNMNYDLEAFSDTKHQFMSAFSLEWGKVGHTTNGTLSSQQIFIGSYHVPSMVRRKGRHSLSYSQLAIAMEVARTFLPSHYTTVPTENISNS